MALGQDLSPSKCLTAGTALGVPLVAGRGDVLAHGREAGAAPAPVHFAGRRRRRKGRIAAVGRDPRRLHSS
eukprot:CAMPEP_0177388232 /NCGR_PEP_ID=MMETSP0368-20130122/51844_1 /TAXON_ID=447022 ORGANISM="Scrippsiella hangoei-like, Strain SHHI-4" /NCGR_SAMPLE_ID=MMETSP0368 /ASSEMBLY_ACC=CAM_ASM_000363 /LENGTH=70 /DNA_ID=CAMNT_0018853407 /DNA_START=18 /DNA_END=227 /DNA_ORIENTATION=+